MFLTTNRTTNKAKLLVGIHRNHGSHGQMSW